MCSLCIIIFKTYLLIFSIFIDSNCEGWKTFCHFFAFILTILLLIRPPMGPAYAAAFRGSLLFEKLFFLI